MLLCSRPRPKWASVPREPRATPRHPIRAVVWGKLLQERASLLVCISASRPRTCYHTTTLCVFSSTSRSTDNSSPSSFFFCRSFNLVFLFDLFWCNSVCPLDCAHAQFVRLINFPLLSQASFQLANSPSTNCSCIPFQIWLTLLL
jgi:hypothetical protein